MRKLVLSALILASVFQTAMGEQSGDWTYAVSNGEATITRYTGIGGALTIPSVVNGIPVVKVGDGQLSLSGSMRNNTITSLTIPNSVTSIGNEAFVALTGLKNLIIPNSVTSIGEFAFAFCTGLTSITIPNSVTSIRRGAFYNCTFLTSIIIPNSVTSIGSSAFSSCQSLTSITIPNSVTSIGEGAFQGCYSLTSITIPNSVTSIGDSAFSTCITLASITIPNSVTSIGDWAFDRCSRLTSITIPNSVTSIGEGAFIDCTALTSITIPNSVASIGGGAFLYCTTLSSVYLPVRFEATYQNFGLTSAQVIFYDASNLAPLYLAGQQSVIANPNTHNLYTTSQIQNMAVGDLVLTRNVGGTFTLNYDIEKSEDLQSWTTYAPLSLTLTNLPPDKAFVRMKVINSSPNPPPSTAIGGNL